jgi:molecular chaperone DnaK
VHEKARAEDLIQRAREAVEKEAGLDQVRPLSSDLQQVISSLPAAAQQAASSAPSGNGSGDGAESADDEEVVDAEFTRD